MTDMASIILLVVLAGVLGVGVGSLVNTLVLRTRLGLPAFAGAKCVCCVEPLAWFDVIPVVSYFALRGRCRHCSTAIEWQYPAVELAMGLLFAVFAARLVLGVNVPPFVSTGELPLLFLRDALVSAFLVVIFLYDYRFSRIPDRFSLPLIVVTLLLNLILGAPPAAVLVGGFVLGGFFALQFLLSRGAWVGGGDVRLGVAMGFLLGLPLGIVALFLAYILGAIGGLILLLTKQRDVHGHVPFGTFLAASTIIVMLVGPEILDWYVGLLS